MNTRRDSMNLTAILALVLSLPLVALAQEQKERIKGTSPEAPALKPSESTSDSIQPVDIVGFWRTVDKNPLSDEYIYQCFSKNMYLDSTLMEETLRPYRITKCSGTTLEFVRDIGENDLGIKTLTSKIILEGGGKIRVKWDDFTDGFVYARVSFEQWKTEYGQQRPDSIDDLVEKAKQCPELFDSRHSKDGAGQGNSSSEGEEPLTQTKIAQPDH